MDFRVIVVDINGVLVIENFLDGRCFEVFIDVINGFIFICLICVIDFCVCVFFMILFYELVVRWEMIVVFWGIFFLILVMFGFLSGFEVEGE